jgi:hypothetical protein
MVSLPEKIIFKICWNYLDSQGKGHAHRASRYLRTKDSYRRILLSKVRKLARHDDSLLGTSNIGEIDLKSQSIKILSAIRKANALPIYFGKANRFFV